MGRFIAILLLLAAPRAAAQPGGIADSGGTSGPMAWAEGETVSHSMTLGGAEPRTFGLLPAHADPDSVRHAAGAQVLITNSGFGLGGHLARRLAADWRVSIEVSVGPGKHEREIALFDRIGRRDVPAKANHLLVIPVRIGVEKRLFRSRIEDNFRPFLYGGLGPTLGWVSPYFDDSNGNGALDSGETSYDAVSALPRGTAIMGVGALVGLGAHFGTSGRSSQGVRLGYRLTRFARSIQLLDPAVAEPRHLFATPSIQIYLTRLF